MNGETEHVLQILVVPACFVVAGLLGYRLGTPARVAGGLVALGCSHLLAFLGGRQALATDGSAADWVHLVSQVLFLGGFVALVWLAAAYPDQRPSTVLVTSAASLAFAGPLLAALSGPTPAMLGGERLLGPVVPALPEVVAGVAVAPLMLLPLLAVATFAVRYRRAGADDRVAMRWPITALAVLAALVVAGTLAGPDHEAVVTVLFLVGAPIFPLAVAFGPVVRRLESLSTDLVEVRDRLVQGTRREVPAGVLERLTPRETTVLEHMAEGMANPVIARSMHLSLSSVEKHATSIFRKLEIPAGPDVHRRVAAVVVYRDALEAAREYS